MSRLAIHHAHCSAEPALQASSRHVPTAPDPARCVNRAHDIRAVRESSEPFVGQGWG